MFELYQLRYFLAVVETGSFTKAAQRMRVAQPTLSVGIQKLEAALSVDLFERSSRRVFLTPAGARFSERARAILSEVQRAEADVAEAPDKAVLHLAVLSTIPASAFSGLLRDFLRAHPEVVVELFEGTEREVKARVEGKRVDAALTLARPDLEASVAPLYEEGYSLAIAAHHPLAGRDTVHVTELADEPTIVRTRCEALPETSRFFLAHGVRPKLVYRTEQDERALAMVAAGLGVTVMPDQYRSPGVARIPLVGFSARRRVALAAPKRRASALVVRFRDFAESQAWR